MIGGKNYDSAFDFTDEDKDMETEKQKKSVEAKPAKNPAPELEDLSDEAMEIVPDSSEDGTEMKQLLEDVIDEGTEQADLKSAFKDIGIDYKKPPQPKPDDGIKLFDEDIEDLDAIPTLDSDLLTEDSEEVPNQTVEMTADFGDEEEAAEVRDKAIDDADKKYTREVFKLRNEERDMNLAISKKESLLKLYEPRLKKIPDELTNLKKERVTAIEKAKEDYKTFMDHEKSKVISLDDARKKKQERDQKNIKKNTGRAIVQPRKRAANS